MTTYPWALLQAASITCKSLFVLVSPVLVAGHNIQIETPADAAPVVTLAVQSNGGLSLLQRGTVTDILVPAVPDSHPGSDKVNSPPTLMRLEHASLLASNATGRLEFRSVGNHTGDFRPSQDIRTANFADVGAGAGLWQGVWTSPVFVLLNFRARVTDAISRLLGASPARQFPQYANDGLSRAGALLLELHLPSRRLSDISHGSHRSLSEFLVQLRNALSTTAGVARKRLNILGIHERFQLNHEQTARLHSNPYALLQNAGGQELLVRFAVTSGDANDVDPQTAVDSLRSAISNRGSKLMRGPLGADLENCTITLSLTGGLTMRTIEQTHTVSHLGLMALPISVSAAFTGMLIWLAAGA